MSTEVLKNHAPVIFGLSRGLLLFLNYVLDFLSGSLLNLDTGFRLGCTVTFHQLKKLLRDFFSPDPPSPLRKLQKLHDPPQPPPLPLKKFLSNFFNGWYVPQVEDESMILRDKSKMIGWSSVTSRRWLDDRPWQAENDWMIFRDRSKMIGWSYMISRRWVDDRPW